MKRRDFVTLLCGAAAWPLAARAQQGERMRRIGVLMTFAEGDPEAKRRIVALRDALETMGWTEGKNLRIEFRWDIDADRIRKDATELVALGLDLIVANAPQSVRALQHASRTVPIVFTAVTYSKADAANKTCGLHKLLRCVEAPGKSMLGGMLESTFSFPAIFFAAIIGVIVFIALSELLLDPHE